MAIKLLEHVVTTVSTRRDLKGSTMGMSRTQCTSSRLYCVVKLTRSNKAHRAKMKDYRSNSSLSIGANG